jgi:integrase/recombinase XerD
MLLPVFKGCSMSSLKIVLRKKQAPDGTFPLCLRITRDRRSSYISLGHYLKESDWDNKSQRVKKSHPNAAHLNTFILKKLSEATENALELDTKKTQVSARAVRQKIKPQVGAMFFEQAQDFLDDLKKAGKYNQYISCKSRIGNFKKFMKGSDIAFADITPGLLDKFAIYMKSTHKPRRGKEKVGDRTVANQLVTIRSVFAHARRSRVIDERVNPFGKGRVQIKFPDTKKVGLDAKEIESLETVALEDPRHDHARNLWLFSFYFAGMRASDVFRLKWSDFQDGRMYYSMGKNAKGGSLKVPEKAIAILEKYRSFQEKEDDFVFPDLKGEDINDPFALQKAISFKVSRYDKFLRLHVAPAANIKKKLTMHIARHSFAQNATNVDVRILQKLFRHTKLETTEGYMGEFIHEEADNALDAVINKAKPRP